MYIQGKDSKLPSHSWWHTHGSGASQCKHHQWEECTRVKSSRDRFWCKSRDPRISLCRVQVMERLADSATNRHSNSWDTSSPRRTNQCAHIIQSLAWARRKLHGTQKNKTRGPLARKNAYGVGASVHAVPSCERGEQLGYPGNPDPLRQGAAVRFQRPSKSRLFIVEAQQPQHAGHHEPCSR